MLADRACPTIAEQENGLPKGETAGARGARMEPLRGKLWAQCPRRYAPRPLLRLVSVDF